MGNAKGAERLSNWLITTDIIQRLEIDVPLETLKHICKLRIGLHVFIGAQFNVRHRKVIKYSLIKFPTRESALAALQMPFQKRPCIWIQGDSVINILQYRHRLCTSSNASPSQRHLLTFRFKPSAYVERILNSTAHVQSRISVVLYLP